MEIKGWNAMEMAKQQFFNRYGLQMMSYSDAVYVWVYLDM